MGKCIEALQTWVPVAGEPETMYWPDPGEAIAKERAEKLAIEEEFSGEAHTAFERLREEGLWPDMSAQACFVMRERMDWAIQMTSQFSLLARSAGCGALKPNSKDVYEVCEWIAFELYDTRFSWPKKWWDGSSFEGYYGL